MVASQDQGQTQTGAQTPLVLPPTETLLQPLLAASEAGATAPDLLSTHRLNLGDIMALIFVLVPLVFCLIILIGSVSS